MSRSVPEPVEILAERLDTSDGRIHLLTCAGIGDLAWLWSKWWSVAQERDVTVWLPQGEAHRAGALAQLYGVKYGYMPNLTSQSVWAHNDRYGDPDVPDSGAVLTVSANRHLEAGKRIDRWYPDLPFRNPAPPSTLATSYKLEANDLRYVVVCMCERNYMEGNLMPGQWARICKMIEASIAPVLIIAGERGIEYARDVLKQFDPTLDPAFCTPLAELLPVIAKSVALVGAASGITILSTYMGVPTLHCYPRWLRPMPGTWEQPGHISDACFMDEAENAVRSGFFDEIIARKNHPHSPEEPLLDTMPVSLIEESRGFTQYEPQPSDEWLSKCPGGA